MTNVELSNPTEEERENARRERFRLFTRAATDESPGPVDGPFRLARRLLAAEPEIAGADVYTALVLGDVDTVRRQVEAAPGWVGEKGGPQRREPLLYATYSKFHRESPERAAGLLATARLLLDRGADPDAAFAPVDFPDCPLRSLCGACGVANFPEMAALLLERGATIDDNESLYHSLEHPDTRCFDLLLARGANPRKTNALHHAFARPGLHAIRSLLEHGADPGEPLGPRGPALCVAIDSGRERAVLELLVEHGADVDAPRGDGRSPYRVALLHGHAEAADFLASRGAAIGGAVGAAIGGAAGATPFERFAEACGRGDGERARRIVEEAPGLLADLGMSERHAFLRLAETGRTAVLAALLDHGFPADVRGPQGVTALHWAAWHGWLDAVTALLAHGADVAAVEETYGATPLGWAVHGSDNGPNPQGDYPGVVRALLAAGAPATSELLPDVGDSGDPEIAALLRAAIGRPVTG
jgi:ankyrin repeat protein